MDFISVKDLSSEVGPDCNRHVSLAMNEKNGIPNTLRLLGTLYHNTLITLDRQNAERMRDFCQGILDCYDRNKSGGEQKK